MWSFYNSGNIWTTSVGDSDASRFRFMVCKDYEKYLCDLLLIINIRTTKRDFRVSYLFCVVVEKNKSDKRSFITSFFYLFVFAGGEKSASDVVRAAQEVMDVEGVHLEEGRLETSRGEDSELSLSFQGYVAELRQCQSKMRTAKMPHGGRSPPEGVDCAADLYKATVVWMPTLLHFERLHCFF